MTIREALQYWTSEDLQKYVSDRGFYTCRSELIFAAGAINNRKLRAELGGTEQARWDEGRRAADPFYVNPYYRET